ncbi:hypothetical protein NDU88_006099 [Pleurodeles waltl]|uniref:Uncharacterized protein n=1 Tax=Pleurodeles waltl TaxID=8319 RepID=A0AAV7TW86_PLEWA|nr:hypothetical protein NDU88_006099 [Pleurodeles waltl]
MAFAGDRVPTLEILIADAEIVRIHVNQPCGLDGPEAGTLGADLAVGSGHGGVRSGHGDAAGVGRPVPARVGAAWGWSRLVGGSAEAAVIQRAPEEWRWRDERCRSRVRREQTMLLELVCGLVTWRSVM